MGSDSDIVAFCAGVGLCRSLKDVILQNESIKYDLMVAHVYLRLCDLNLDADSAHMLLCLCCVTRPAGRIVCSLFLIEIYAVESSCSENNF